MTANVKVGFPPIAAPNARLLILGTLPGEDSLKLRQYYAHKHNAFWRLVASVFSEDVPVGYEDRQRLLIRNRCALWDVLHAAERIGSSDAAIKNPRANAFQDFFNDHPRIKAVAFNGQKARALFKTHIIGKSLALPDGFEFIDLPSSSPLHTMAFEQKRALWTAALTKFNPT